MPDGGRLAHSAPWGLPRIGMRILKSSLVVFLCFVIYWLRGQSGLPFYSGVAAIICVQTDVGSSLRIARDRTIGTFIGGVVGTLFLLLDRATGIGTSYALVHYLFISLAIIPLIYITVLIRRRDAATITCVVFMSIAIGHVGDGSAYEFALQRMFDTLIGIFVSLGVNAFRLPGRAGRTTLFVTDLDGTLLHSDGKLGTATVVKLNQMLESGAMITIATNRTPASFIPLFEGVNLKLPVIAINGAALYDLAGRRYEECRAIPEASALRLRAWFKERGRELFVSTVINDVQHIYYGDLTDPDSLDYCHHWRNMPGKYYVHSPPPDGYPVLCLTAVGRRPEIDGLRAGVDGMAEELEVYTRLSPSPRVPELYILDIYSVRASRQAAMLAMKERLGARRTVFFGNSDDDVPLMLAADAGYAVAGGGEQIRNAADAVIGTNDGDAPARVMHRLFYWKRLKKRREDSPESE